MFFDDNIEFTKHGYYEVDGFKTLSKFEAYRFAAGNIDKVKFIYNDDVMAMNDWTVEPAEDIYELYAERARQLRHKYDYLVLMYSGGIDSHTALRSFMDNGIHLNEICTFNNAKVEYKTDKFNQEVFNAAIPFVDSLDLHTMGTKFRLVDISELIINQYHDEFHFENHHFYNQGTAPSWVNATRSHLFKAKIKDHVKLTEQGKTVCYIWGFDKPNVLLHENKYAMYFYDAMVDLNMRQYINRKVLAVNFGNFYDESFYICREFPKITIKQGHLLLNLIKRTSVDDTRLKSQDDLAATGPFVIHHRFKYFRFLSKKMVDGCIYPRADLARFGNDKVKGSIILSAKDSWFNNSTHENKNKLFQKLSNLSIQNPDYFIKKNNILIGIKPIASRPYIIGDYTFHENNQT
jgi:hypothetical protein